MTNLIYVSVVDDSPVASTVVEPAPILVTVIADGIPGPPGAAGASGASSVFDQNVAAATWNVTHNLGYFPAVTVVDTLLREVVADVHHVDVNHLTILFASPNTGHAFMT